MGSNDQEVLTIRVRPMRSIGNVEWGSDKKLTFYPAKLSVDGCGLPSRLDFSRIALLLVWLIIPGVLHSIYTPLIQLEAINLATNASLGSGWSFHHYIWSLEILINAWCSSTRFYVSTAGPKRLCGWTTHYELLITSSRDRRILAMIFSDLVLLKRNFPWVR